MWLTIQVRKLATAKVGQRIRGRLSRKNYTSYSVSELAETVSPFFSDNSLQIKQAMLQRLKERRAKENAPELAAVLSESRMGDLGTAMMQVGTGGYRSAPQGDHRILQAAHDRTSALQREYRAWHVPC